MVAARTPGRSFRTRSTVASETPATRATSFVVGFAPGSIGLPINAGSAFQRLGQSFENQRDSLGTRIIVPFQIFGGDIGGASGFRTVD